MTISKTEIANFVNAKIENDGYYLVDVVLSADGRIVVEIDNNEGVDIDYCATLSRTIGETFAPEIDDYELEVGSAGLTSPFKVVGQYKKNIGNEVEVLTNDGKKLKGILSEVDADGFKLAVQEKVKLEGQKRPVLEDRIYEFGFKDVKYTKYILQF